MKKNDKRRVRVLVVEDNPDLASALCEFLSLMGYEVASAGTGTEVLDRAAGQDIILLDLCLPDISGLEVAGILRGRGCTARLLGLSGFEEPDGSAFDGFLTKPVDLVGLLRFIGHREVAIPPDPQVAPA